MDILELAAIAVVTGGVTIMSVTRGALSFAKTIDKREATQAERDQDDARREQADERDRAERAKKIEEIRLRRNRGEKPVLEPFHAFAGADCLPCPKCGAEPELPAANQEHNASEGVCYKPHVCQDPELCLAGGDPHFHVKCWTCGMTWLMRPKDAE